MKKLILLLSLILFSGCSSEHTGYPADDELGEIICAEHGGLEKFKTSNDGEDEFSGCLRYFCSYGYSEHLCKYGQDYKDLYKEYMEARNEP